MTERQINDLCQWIAWRLPRRLVKWCALRLIAYGTMGQYGTTEPRTLDVMEALRRWDA